MKALVTGANGFIGRALCRALLEAGYAVRATRRGPLDDGLDERLDWHRVQLEETGDWAPLLEGIDVVFHLAWSTIPATADADPAADLACNVGGLVRLLEGVRRRPGIRFVFPSSGGTVYGRAEQLPIPETAATRPIGPYGVSKLTAETYCDLYRVQFGVDAAVLRIANPYGGEQDPEKGLGAVFHFARAAIAHRPIVIHGDGSVVRDFVHIEDVVAALLATASTPALSGPVNIGSGVGRSLASVVRDLEVLLGRPLAIVHAPMRRFDVPACVLDIARARQLLDWSPRIALDAGLASLVATLEQRGSP